MFGGGRRTDDGRRRRVEKCPWYAWHLLRAPLLTSKKDRQGRQAGSQSVHAHRIACSLDSRVVQCVWPSVPDMDFSIVNLPPPPRPLRHRFEPAIQPSSHKALTGVTDA